MVNRFEIFFVEIGNTQYFLYFGNSVLRQGCAFGLFVNFVVGIGIKFPHKLGKFVVFIGRFSIRSGDNKGSSGLVNQNRVDLVNDGKVVPTLGHFIQGRNHIVPQVIKPEFVVGSVSNIRLVSFLSLGGVKVGQALISSA